MANFDQRDQTVYGNQYNADEQNIQNQKKQGDNYDFKGAKIDNRGGVFGVGSTQSDIRINITTNVPAQANDDQKAELEALLTKLQAELEEVKTQKPQEAEAVAKLNNSLIEEASKENPNPTLLQVTGEGLKQAAQNLVDIAPQIGVIAGKIVLGVLSIAG